MRNTLKQSQFLVGMVNAVRKIPYDMQVAKWKRQRVPLIHNYFAKNTVRKLQVGCGKNILDGWLNADLTPLNSNVAYLDATAPFPFPNESFDYVFSEHVIEHLFYPAGQNMLRECFRCLKPGGVIRISTPNLKNIVTLITNAQGDIQKQYVKRSSDRYVRINTRYLPGFVVNNFFWDFGHYFVYDPDTLTQAFEEAGFNNIIQSSIGSSQHRELDNLETHGRVVGEDLNQFESMVLEATRPK